MTALGAKWEQPAPDDEWTPRRIVEHTIGTEVLMASRMSEAMQAKAAEFERLPLETLEAALARLDVAAGIADRANRYVEDRDLLKVGNPPGGDYPRTVEGILLNAVSHLAEHTATLKSRI